jgi:hypothetical protein
MPCAQVERHVLHNLAVPAHEEVRRHVEVGTLSKNGCASRGSRFVNSWSIHGHRNPRAAG